MDIKKDAEDLLSKVDKLKAMIANAKKKDITINEKSVKVLYMGKENVVLTFENSEQAEEYFNKL